MTDRKSMSSSALRKRRQAIKKERATLKRELAAIEAEMAGRREPVVLRREGEVTLSTNPQPVASMALPQGARLITRRSPDGLHMQVAVRYADGRELVMQVPAGAAPKLPGLSYGDC